MKVCIIPSNNLFASYGGAEIYVRNLVDELIRQYECLSLFVISIGDEMTIQDYRGIKVYSVKNPDGMSHVIEQLMPDIIHANGLYDWIIPICQEKHIKCLLTIHDAMYICPVYTLLDYKERLCSKKMSHQNCLRCMLSNIKGGCFAYPFIKYIPENTSIRIGNWFDTKPFIYYITPIAKAALGIRQRIDYWKHYICKADKVILLNPRMVEMAKKNGLTENQISLLSNGIPKVDNVPIFPSFDNGIKFFYFGRMCYSKGIHILLKAFHKIQHSRIELHLIGRDDNPYTFTLQNKYKDDLRIKWHGFIEHDFINETIAPFHVMVHPSIANETCSLSILEALALGKYVIATKCGGPESLIQQDINGVLAEPNNAEGLSILMKQYIANPHPPTQITYMTMKEHVSILQNLYTQILSS